MKTFIMFQVSWLGEGSQEKQNENWPHFVVCMKMMFVLVFKSKKNKNMSIKVKFNIYLNFKHVLFITVHI